jgi:hypothetical protein
LSERVTSLVYDIEVRGESKWNLLTEPQRARFIEMLLLGATLEVLLQYHDNCVEENSSMDPGDDKELKKFVGVCFEEWNDKVKTGRAHCWSTRGVSEFRDEVRATRQRTVGNAAIAAEFARAIVDVEKQTGFSQGEAGLKILAAAYAKLGTGVVNVHTPEGRALLDEAKQALVEIRNTELRDAERKDRLALKNRELDARAESKLDAGLKEIEKAAGKNAKVKAALASIRAAFQEAA